MAYLSSTEGSSAVVPALVTQGIATLGLHKSTPSTGAKGYAPKVWTYNSTHTPAEITAAGFFTDGKILGMSLGDTLIAQGSTTYAQSHHTIDALTSTGASLSTGVSGT